MKQAASKPKAQFTHRDGDVLVWKNAVCMFMTEGYGEKMKGLVGKKSTPLGRSAMCELLLFTLWQNTVIGYSKPRTVLNPQCMTKHMLFWDRLLLSSKRSSRSLYCLRNAWVLTEKQRVSVSLEVFHHEVARCVFRGKPECEKTSAYIIRNVHEPSGCGSSSYESRVLACTVIFLWFFTDKLVWSWRRPICREMTGIFRDVSTAFSGKILHRFTQFTLGVISVDQTSAFFLCHISSWIFKAAVNIYLFNPLPVWGSSQLGCTLDVTCSYSNVYITYQACDLIFCDRFVERLRDLLDLW